MEEKRRKFIHKDRPKYPDGYFKVTQPDEVKKVEIKEGKITKIPLLKYS